MKGIYTRSVFIILGVVILFLVYTQIGQDAHQIGAKLSPLNNNDVQISPDWSPARNISHTTTQAPTQTEPPDYMIPSDEDLYKMNENQWMMVYWKYINRLQVLCRDVVRVGSLKDGGKEICVDEPYRPKPPCIVYSFGINYLFDFDKSVAAHFGCQVFCFDPSMTNNSQQITDKIWFYKIGLGSENKINQYGWQINTLDTIRANLGHSNTTIDILKIDIEGDEWVSLLQMVAAGSLQGVKQMSMETHFSRTHVGSSKYWGDESSAKPLIALRQLYETGFRIFMRERNPYSFMPWPGVGGTIANVNEISLIKI